VAGRVFNDKIVVAVICILAAFLNAVYIYTNLTAVQTNEAQSGSSDSISFLRLHFLHCEWLPELHLPVMWLLLSLLLCFLM